MHPHGCLQTSTGCDRVHLEVGFDTQRSCGPRLQRLCGLNLYDGSNTLRQTIPGVVRVFTELLKTC